MLINCPSCAIELKGKRNLKPRAKERLLKGKLLGIEVIWPKVCRKCKALFYVLLYNPLDVSDYEPPKLVTELQYSGASAYVGKVRGGTTASDYTRAICRPADDLIEFHRRRESA